MLNRTNRTLSANTNRLDLGTRKLDQDASDNIGSLTLRTARLFPAATVRAGVVEYPGLPMEGPPIPAGPKRVEPAMPAMSGSSPRPSSPSRDFRGWDQGSSVAVSSQPTQPGAVFRDVVGTGRGVEPRFTSSPGHPGTSPGWHCREMRLAGRSAHAALALVSEAAP